MIGNPLSQANNRRHNPATATRPALPPGGAQTPSHGAISGKAGHSGALSPGKAMRAKCLDCCAGLPGEVRLCTATGCPLWPYRMGRNPNRARRVGGEA